MAAVALPQYTKAVEKARAAEAMQVLGDIATAEQVYYMSHRSFLADASKYDEDMDVTIPGYNADCTVGTTKKAGIETSSYCVTSALGTGGDAANLVLTAFRKNGTYGGDAITLKVEPSGKLTRGTTATKGLDSLVGSTWK